jgi:hypothetical protein
LGAYLDLTLGQSLLSSKEMEGSWCNYDFNLVGIELELIKDLFWELSCELDSSVLFPVSTD